MSRQSIEAINQKIRNLNAKRALLVAREKTAQLRRTEREARDIGLWLIENHPKAADFVRQQLFNKL